MLFPGHLLALLSTAPLLAHGQWAMRTPPVRGMAMSEEMVYGSTSATCHGLPSKGPGTKLEAGTTLTTIFGLPPSSGHGGNGTHGERGMAVAPRTGGHCEWSISYDGAVTFAAIHRVNHTCGKIPENLQPEEEYIHIYDVPLPATLPSAEMAIFGWTWVPSGGEAAMWMGCADVRIQGVASTTWAGQSAVFHNIDGYPSYGPWEGIVDPSIEEFYSSSVPVTLTVALGASSTGPVDASPGEVEGLEEGGEGEGEGEGE